MATVRAPRTWEEYARQVGLTLQRLRQESELSQEQVAHRAGVTRNYYQQLERGRLSTGKPANPTLKVVLQLALVLGVSVDALAPMPRPTVFD